MIEKNMSMIIYNVTVNVNEEIQEDWLRWMNQEHIPDVLQTGCFLDARISRLLQIEEMGGITYSIQYSLESEDQLERYRVEHATRLQALHSKKFNGKFAAFRTVMEVVGHHKPK
jgi:hypothetical protein